jgi:hypothetical protein
MREFVDLVTPYAPWLGTALVALLVLARAGWWGCKGAWHAGAWLARARPLDAHVADLITAIESGPAGVGKDAGTLTLSAASAEVATGKGTCAVRASGMDVSGVYTAAELRAIRRAALRRLDAIRAADREAARQLVAATVAAPQQPGRPRCSCGLASCGVCGGRASRN